MNCSAFHYQYDANQVLRALPDDPYDLDYVVGLGPPPGDEDGIACNFPSRSEIEPLAPLDGSPTTGAVLPAALPDGLQEVEIEKVLGTEWIEVKQNRRWRRDRHFRVSLIGVTMPTRSGERECHYTQSQSHLEQRLLREGTIVYLEPDELEIVDEGLFEKRARWMWIQRAGGYDLVNRILVEEGDAVVAIIPPNEKYAGELRQTQPEAIREKRGLWGWCN